jgi:hypothetical protein
MRIVSLRLLRGENPRDLAKFDLEVAPGIVAPELKLRVAADGTIAVFAPSVRGMRSIRMEPDKRAQVAQLATAAFQAIGGAVNAGA